MRSLPARAVPCAHPAEGSAVPGAGAERGHKAFAVSEACVADKD